MGGTRNRIWNELWLRIFLPLRNWKRCINTRRSSVIGEWSERIESFTFIQSMYPYISQIVHQWSQLNLHSMSGLDVSYITWRLLFPPPFPDFVLKTPRTGSHWPLSTSAQCLGQDPVFKIKTDPYVPCWVVPNWNYVGKLLWQLDVAFVHFIVKGLLRKPKQPPHLA